MVSDASADQAREHQLRDSQRLLGSLAQKLQAQRDQDMRQVAHRLHDDLGQLLNAARLELGQLHRQLARGSLVAADLDRLDELLGRSTNSTRSLVRDLRPPVLDLGIVPALESLCHEYSRRHGVACKLRAPDDLPLPPFMVDSVYRIADDALRNTAAHAASGSTRMWLRLVGSALLFDIDHDGRGFDPAAVAPATLQRMQERGLLMAGTLTLDRGPGQGSRLRLRAPLTASLTDPPSSPARTPAVAAIPPPPGPHPSRTP